MKWRRIGISPTHPNVITEPLVTTKTCIQGNGMANIQTKQMLAVYLKHSWKSTVKWNHSKHIECIQVHPKSWAIRDQIVNHSFSCFGQCWNQKFLHVQYCIPTIITRKTAPHLMQCHQNLPTAQPQLKSAKRNHDTHKRTINRNTQWPKSQYQRFYRTMLQQMLTLCMSMHGRKRTAHWTDRRDPVKHQNCGYFNVPTAARETRKGTQVGVVTYWRAVWVWLK